MSFLDKLIKLENRNYEFDAELEVHPIGNQNIYRLHYVDYHRIGEYKGRRDNNIGVIDFCFKPFMLPLGMSRENSFKVLSYLTDYMEKEYNLEPCSVKGVQLLDKAIDLERLGFRRVNISFKSVSDEVIDLFTVTGRLLLFKNSDFYPRYFEWYTEGVTFDEVKEIYAECGIEFHDLIRNDEKVLSKKM